MKSNLRVSIALLVLLVSVVMLPGCNGNGNGWLRDAPTASVQKDRPSFADYRSASQDERDSMMELYGDAKALSYEYKMQLYRFGDKVCNDDASLCQVFDPTTNQATFWWKDKELFGANTTLVGTFQTDSQGVPIRGQAAVLKSAATVAGIGRQTLDNAFGVLATASNGLLPTMLQLENCKDGNCGGSGVGPITTIVSAGARSDSSAEQTSTANATGGRPAPKPVAPPSMGVTY